MAKPEIETRPQTLDIPLCKLLPCKANVRRTDKGIDIESLAEDIAAHGVLQNLNVIACGNGKFAVSAGGRRLAALKLLVQQSRIAKDYRVPCRIVEEADAAEFSLAENVQRVAMNAMDEMEAFAALVDEGMSVEDVASRFGLSIRHVEQRLALGRLSPKLRAAYRKAEITLDVARAFCLTDDHGVQERLFKQFAKPLTHAPSVRAALSQGRIPASDKLVRFVGLDAYEAAGGRLVRDLFDNEVALLEDGDLLQRLAGERADQLRAELAAEGWGWTEVQFGHAQIEGCAPERLRASQRPLTPEEAEAIAALEAQIEDLDQQLETDDENDALWNERDHAEAKRDALRQTAQVWDAAQLPHAGAVIAIDRDGKPVITRGLIKRADLKAVRKLQKAQSEPSGDEESGDAGATSIATSDHPRLPRTLVEDLTKARTRGLRAELAGAPHIALALIVHVLQQRSAGASGFPGVEIASRPIGYDDADAFEQDRTAMGRAAPELSEDQLVMLIAQSDAQLLGTLALLLAETLDFSHKGATLQDSALQDASDALASALDLDMRRYWDASADFWERTPKAFILDALASAPPIAGMPEAKRKARVAALAKLKKAALARTAAKSLQSTGWLPEVLITPPRAGGFAISADGEAALAQAHVA